MTLGEAIKLYEEKAEEMENKSRKKNDGTVSTSIKYKECASEHRQLAEWLKELKRLRKEQREVYENGYKEGHEDGYDEGYAEAYKEVNADEDSD